MTANPYAGKPDSAFWRRAVAEPEPSSVDPVIEASFTLSPSDRVATAGSCFAQHIARTLVRKGFHYLVTEQGPEAENYGLFPARFGNIYSTLQLLQLFQRAYGLFEPKEQIWKIGQDFVDPFRPLMARFDTAEQLEIDRAKHLLAVREMFETCDTFIFTLGLTETWIAAADGAAVPLAPGVSNTVAETAYRFTNRRVAEMVDDMNTFIAKLRSVNPDVRIILTVSPVPLIATFEDRHVLVSTIYSKSALRVVAEEVVHANDDVAYFPSYEIITGHHAGYEYFADDLREVLPEGVDRVMGLFTRHYLTGTGTAAPKLRKRRFQRAPDETDALYAVICDEEKIAE
jgi:hypothetical protein